MRHGPVVALGAAVSTATGADRSRPAGPAGGARAGGGGGGGGGGRGAGGRRFLLARRGLGRRRAVAGAAAPPPAHPRPRVPGRPGPPRVPARPRPCTPRRARRIQGETPALEPPLYF